jgi:hypothetical protein
VEDQREIVFEQDNNRRGKNKGNAISDVELVEWEEARCVVTFGSLTVATLIVSTIDVTLPVAIDLALSIPSPRMSHFITTSYSNTTARLSRKYALKSHVRIFRTQHLDPMFRRRWHISISSPI